MGWRILALVLCFYCPGFPNAIRVGALAILEEFVWFALDKYVKIFQVPFFRQKMNIIKGGQLSWLICDLFINSVMKALSGTTLHMERVFIQQHSTSAGDSLYFVMTHFRKHCKQQQQLPKVFLFVFFRYEGDWFQNMMQGHGVIEVDLPVDEPIPDSESVFWLFKLYFVSNLEILCYGAGLYMSQCTYVGNSYSEKQSRPRKKVRF